MATETLAGKVAIVTGGSSGIGKATVRVLADAGATVIFTATNQQRIDRAVAEINSTGLTVDGRASDVSDDAAWASLVAGVMAEHGRLDVLFNCAAILQADVIGDDTDAATIDPEHFLRILEVNLLGTALGCKHAVPAMIASGGGSIVNTSSLYADTADSIMTAYAASKGGVNSLTRHVAWQYGKSGIRCNAVAPGVIVTESNRDYFSPERFDSILRHISSPRLGVPEDIANLVLFLASARSEYLTGQILTVDGGFMLNHFPAIDESTAGTDQSA